MSRGCLVCGPRPFATTSRSGFFHRRSERTANVVTMTVCFFVWRWCSALERRGSPWMKYASSFSGSRPGRVHRNAGINSRNGKSRSSGDGLRGLRQWKLCLSAWRTVGAMHSTSAAREFFGKVFWIWKTTELRAGFRESGLRLRKSGQKNDVTLAEFCH